MQEFITKASGFVYNGFLYDVFFALGFVAVFFFFLWRGKYFNVSPLKSVVLVANLAPRKMKGIMSEGMLLCSENSDGSLKLLSSEGAEPGAEIG